MQRRIRNAREFGSLVLALTPALVGISCFVLAAAIISAGE